MIKQRTCISCRSIKNKDDLYRIVISNNEAFLDEKQLLPGRGAYVCTNNSCIDKLINKKILNRIFKMEINVEALGRSFNDR